MKMKILSLLLLVFLMTVSTGCSILRPEPVEKIITKEVLVKKLPLKLKNPEPIDWLGVKWMIITPETYESRIEELKRDGKSLAIFALDKDSYEAISINMAEILKYMEEQSFILAQYREYYESEDESENSEEEK